MSHPTPTSPVSSPGLKPDQAGPAPRRHWVRWILLTAVLLAVGYAVFVRPFLRPAASARAGLEARPTPVAAEPARRADLNVRLAALGTVTPVYTVTIRSRVDGELKKLYFTEG